MTVKDRQRDIAFNIAEDPTPGLTRTIIFESYAAPSANNEGSQIQQDMRDLGLDVTSISDPQFQGGAGGSSITVSYTYNPNANISESLRANIASESTRIANEKAQSPTIIRNHIQNLIEKNPSNNDKWEMALKSSDNPKYLLEYLGKNCPEGSFGSYETNINNEHQQMIWVNKNNGAFSDLALLENKLVKDKSALSPEQQTDKAADDYAKQFVKQIGDELNNKIPGSKSSVWNVELQQPINNPAALAAIQRGLSQAFPALEATHKITTPTSGMMSGRTISTFTVTMKSPDALSETGLNGILNRKPTPQPSSATDSPVLYSAPSVTPKPQIAAKAPLEYYNDLLESINKNDKAGYRSTMDQLWNDPNTDQKDITMKILNKHEVKLEPQMNAIASEILKEKISEAKESAATSKGSTASSPGSIPSLKPPSPF